MAYANAKGIPYVALAGQNEISQGKITLKDMKTGEQTLLDIQQAIERIIHN